MYDKLPLIITAIAYILVQAHAQDWGGASDPLSPNFVGETMSTGMDLELVQQAKDAGIIKENNPMYNSVSSPKVTYLGTPPAGAEMDVSSDISPAINLAEPGNAIENANVTGAWSLELTGEITRHIDLSLKQNKDTVMGYGAMTGGNGTQRITASGSLAAGRIALTVMPVNSLDLYKLDLSIDSNTAGSYTAYSANGDTWSGDVTGAAPAGIFLIASDTNASDSPQSPGADTVTPIRTGTASSAASSSSVAHLGSGSASFSQGSSGSVSSSTSISMGSSGGSSGMQSMSSISSA